MDKEVLQRLIDKYRANMDYYHNNQNAYNETECRDEYINPLLECFGWDVHNKKGKLPQYKEVVVEKYSNSSERPDYTLTLNGIKQFFVEAKKPSVAIDVEVGPALQTRRYGWNAGHSISVLTNFEYLLIYDTAIQPRIEDDARTALYRKYYFEEYLEKFDEMSELLSRDNVYCGKYDEYVKKHLAKNEGYRTEIDDTFLEQLNDWRLRLGKHLFKKGREYTDIRVLNDSVQEFINQIIFLRICEDRKLPLYRRLFDLTFDDILMRGSLIDVFREADKRYNSGLFKYDTQVFDISNDIIYEMIKSLYYPRTPYLFSIIDPSFLGKVYEAFLTESLVIENGEIVLAQKSEYKYKSVVSTPVEIVKYMVKTTMEPLCNGKTPEEVCALRIIDIACGSGVFLLEAYQYLIEYCTKWYEENDNTILLEISDGRKKLPFDFKKRILISCIYGVDIDTHAVEVSKFSLLLKLLEDENEPSVIGEQPILPDLASNIQPGNSLVTSKDISAKNVNIEQLLSLVPFDWENINEGKGFDAVIGNPPYVKTEDIYALSGEIEFDIYKKKYQSAFKQYDKYFLFIEKALDLLKEQGVLCYIVPNKFFKIAAGQELRKLICKRMWFIDDFGDAQLFPDKTIYSSIIGVAASRRDTMRYSSVATVTDLWVGDNVESVDVSNDMLSQNPWSLSTDIEIMKLVESLRGESAALSDVALIFNGIQTSAERPEKFSDKKEVYWFDKACVRLEDDTYIYVNRYGKEYKIEKAILKPYFKPTKASEKGMDTYSLLKTDKRIIFPYDSDGKLYDIDTMQAMFPGTYEYLLDCYDRLVPRCLNGGVGRDVPDATTETWYKYGRTQALTAFVNTPKLIVRVLSKEPMYAYDAEDMLIASGGTAGYCAISKKNDSQYELEYIQAWLAHPYTERILQIQGSDFENGFTARGTFLLKKLPFVQLDFADEKQKIIYESVIEKTRSIYELNRMLLQNHDKASKNVLIYRKKVTALEIQKLIGKVYHRDF